LPYPSRRDQGWDVNTGATAPNFLSRCGPGFVVFFGTDPQWFDRRLQTARAVSCLQISADSVLYAPPPPPSLRLRMEGGGGGGGRSINFSAFPRGLACREQGRLGPGLHAAGTAKHVTAQNVNTLARRVMVSSRVGSGSTAANSGRNHFFPIDFASVFIWLFAPQAARFRATSRTNPRETENPQPNVARFRKRKFGRG